MYGLPASFRLFGEGQIGPIPMPIIYLIVIAGAGGLILRRTKLGRYAYAIGSNQEAARLSGIPLNRYLIVIYMIPAALAGFGGMIAASLVHSGQPNYGVGLELNVIAACVIGGASLFGGVGTIGGTMIGAFLIAVVTNGAVLLNITQYYQQVIIGVIIWLAVWWIRFAAGDCPRCPSSSSDGRPTAMIAVKGAPGPSRGAPIVVAVVLIFTGDL